LPAVGKAILFYNLLPDGCVACYVRLLVLLLLLLCVGWRGGAGGLKVGSSRPVSTRVVFVL
jgi:hypothetical protein